MNKADNNFVNNVEISRSVRSKNRPSMAVFSHSGACALVSAGTVDGKSVDLDDG